MDWSKITTSGDLTEKVLAQAACTREDTYAILDLIHQFDEPFKIESKLIRLFILAAAESWIGNRLTIEIAFKDVEQGRLSYDCRIRLLAPIGDGSHELLKQIKVKASHMAFRDVMRDRKKLAPFTLEDNFKGKYILKVERAMSLAPPEVAQSRQKLEALFSRKNKPMTIPPAMKKALDASKRKPNPVAVDKPVQAGKQAEPAKPAPQARVPSLGSDKRKKTRTYFDVSLSEPERPPPIMETFEVDQNWDDEPPTTPKTPPKPRT